MIMRRIKRWVMRRPLQASTAEDTVRAEEILTRARSRYLQLQLEARLLAERKKRTHV